jgi:hypothetical protein
VLCFVPTTCVGVDSAERVDSVLSWERNRRLQWDAMGLGSRGDAQPRDDASSDGGRCPVVMEDGAGGRTGEAPVRRRVGSAPRSIERVPTRVPNRSRSRGMGT